jgi:hypothetical protein
VDRSANNKILAEPTLASSNPNPPNTLTKPMTLQAQHAGFSPEKTPNPLRDLPTRDERHSA